MISVLKKIGKHTEKSIFQSKLWLKAIPFWTRSFLLKLILSLLRNRSCSVWVLTKKLFPKGAVLIRNGFQLLQTCVKKVIGT